MTQMRHIAYLDAEPVMAALFAGERLARAEALGSVAVHQGLPADTADFAARVGEAAGLLVGWNLPSEVMRQAPALETIGYMGIGAANFIDLEEAAKLGITVTNTPGYGNNAVAEHALALLLAVAREVPRLDRLFRQKGWDQFEPGFELRGKRLGLIGFGGIGARMAELGRALGMEVRAWTRNPSQARARQYGIDFIPLDQLLAESDVLSLHLLLTPETEGLLGAKELDRTKPGVVLINTARAELVDENALVERLQSGRIAAAGLDVFWEEPLPADHPLLTLDNAVLTPHVGFNTPEAAAAMLDMAIDNLARYFAGDPRNVIAEPGR